MTMTLVGLFSRLLQLGPPSSFLASPPSPGVPSSIFSFSPLPSCCVVTCSEKRVNVNVDTDGSRNQNFGSQSTTYHSLMSNAITHTTYDTMALSTTLLTRRAMRAQRLLRVPSEVQRLAPISPISSFASRSYSAPPPNSRDKGEQVIYDKLSARFPGKTLEVQDVSGERYVPRPS